MENGFFEIYTNTKVDDGTTIEERMQFFKNSTGYHKNSPHLSNRVKLFKETEEGVKLMSEIVEKIKAEGRKEGKRIEFLTESNKQVSEVIFVHPHYIEDHSET